MKTRNSITLAPYQAIELAEQYGLLAGKVDNERYLVNAYPFDFKRPKFTIKQMKWIAHQFETHNIADPVSLQALFEKLREHKVAQ
jgi:hypothetical protein